MTLCDNSDHDGAGVPAIVHIEVADGRHVDRCLWCAEGVATSLMRNGLGFTVTPRAQVSVPE